MPEPLNIDVAGAEAALAAAGVPEDLSTPVQGVEQPREPNGQWTNKPAPEPTNTDVAEEAAPAGDNSTEETATEDPFTQIDESSLTPEMQQLRKSLQADYTRKMQEIAPLRKLGDEFGFESPEDFRVAAEVYRRLNDPNNWPTIHQELSSYMEQYGLSPAAASRQAADLMAGATPAEDFDEEYGEFDEGADPSTAPAFRALQQQVQQLSQQLAQRTEMERQQELWNATAQKLTDAENKIRAANPDYTDAEITDIYNLLGPEGDLEAARDRYESMIGRRLGQYINTKAAAQSGTPAALPGAGTQTQPTADDALEGMTADQIREVMHRRAMAHVTELDRQG